MWGAGLDIYNIVDFRLDAMLGAPQGGNPLSQNGQLTLLTRAFAFLHASLEDRPFFTYHDTNVRAYPPFPCPLHIRAVLACRPSVVLLCTYGVWRLLIELCSCWAELEIGLSLQHLQVFGDCGGQTLFAIPLLCTTMSDALTVANHCHINELGARLQDPTVVDYMIVSGERHLGPPSHKGLGFSLNRAIRLDSFCEVSVTE